MTDEEFTVRYEALKADLLKAWDTHAGGVPCDERGLRGGMLAAFTSTAARLITRDIGIEQCHALFVAMGEWRKQALEALTASKGRMDAVMRQQSPLDEATARALRIADTAAEELIRTEGATSSYADEFSFAPCEIDDHLRDCIEHLCTRGLAEQHEHDDGTVMVQLLVDLDRSQEGLLT